MKYLIFDYNGTILDDVGLSLEALNHIVAKYMDREPVSMEEYLNKFDFPVKDYYARVGFDFERNSFETIGDDWNSYYRSHFSKAMLRPEVLDFIVEAKAKGYEMAVLSAAYQDALESEMKLLELDGYFEKLLGADNVYGTSKLERGREFVKAHPDKEFLLIGDTYHDYETAMAMGAECILVAKGHQSRERLMTYGCRVVEKIGDIEL